MPKTELGEHVNGQVSGAPKNKELKNGRSEKLIVVESLAELIRGISELENSRTGAREFQLPMQLDHDEQLEVMRVLGIIRRRGTPLRQIMDFGLTTRIVVDFRPALAGHDL